MCYICCLPTLYGYKYQGKTNLIWINTRASTFFIMGSQSILCHFWICRLKEKESPLWEVLYWFGCTILNFQIWCEVWHHQEILAHLYRIKHKGNCEIGVFYFCFEGICCIMEKGHYCWGETHHISNGIQSKSGWDQMLYWKIQVSKHKLFFSSQNTIIFLDDKTPLFGVICWTKHTKRVSRFDK